MVASQTPAPAPTASVVGNTFVKQYYNLLLNKPSSLHRFYKDESSLTRCSESETSETVLGQRLIEAKINSLGFKDCGASIDYIDCQLSLSDGVMVMVTGSLSNAGQSPRRFSQSFFLAPQPNGYYVLNDIFRYLDTVPHMNSVSADDDEEPHAEAAPAAHVHEPVAAVVHPPPAAAEPPAVSIAAAPAPPAAEPAAVAAPPPAAAVPAAAPQQPTASVPAESKAATEAAPRSNGTNATSDDYLEYTDPKPSSEREPGAKKTTPQPLKSWAAVASTKPVVTVPEAPAPPPVPAGEAEPAPIEFGSHGPMDPNEHRRPPQQDNNSVYVCYLVNVKKEELQAKMEKYGPVQSVVVHAKEGNATDYAFVNFKTSDGPKNLFDAYPDRRFQVDGNECVMQIEERTGPRRDGAGRGRGRGGRDGGKGVGRGSGKEFVGKPTAAAGDSRVPQRRAAAEEAGGRGGRGRGDGQANSARPEGRGSGKVPREGGKGGKPPRKAEQ